MARLLEVGRGRGGADGGVVDGDGDHVGGGQEGDTRASYPGPPVRESRRDRARQLLCHGRLLDSHLPLGEHIHQTR